MPILVLLVLEYYSECSTCNRIYVYCSNAAFTVLDFIPSFPPFSLKLFYQLQQKSPNTKAVFQRQSLSS